MNRNRNIVAESVVVKDIDAEEEDDIDNPATNRDLVRRQKERRPGDVELRNVARDSHEEELHKCKEEAW